MDVLVVPATWYENTPLVMLEAMQAGVPVIASDLGGMSELIDEGRNGFLFEAGDVGALAALLRRCLDDPSILACMRPEPPPSIAANYTAFRELYREDQG
jgi:glycosyltransferase involved in cell wall biosynthesis